jgi:hypothetical protein
MRRKGIKDKKEKTNTGEGQQGPCKAVVMVSFLTKMLVAQVFI